MQQQMMNKLVDILEQFLREIIAAQEMFDRCKDNPPLTRNQPPVAGMCCCTCQSCNQSFKTILATLAHRKFHTGLLQLLDSLQPAEEVENSSSTYKYPTILPPQ